METNNDFLPSNYVQPSNGGGYFKFEKGENRFRILSKPVIGWIDWDNKKSIRSQMANKPQPIDPTKAVKHFWAFVIWDSKSNAIKILEITQSGIQASIAALSKDADWGSPFGYDIKIVKAGEGMETTYTVNPVPHKPITPEIKEMLSKKPIDLNKLFEGADPFDTTNVIKVIEPVPF